MPDWKLYVILDEATPREVVSIVESYAVDPRVSFMFDCGHSLPAALNLGMAAARSEFLCVLLSDDRFDTQAIEVMNGYVERFPEVDFFYSARRLIDSRGEFRTEVLPSLPCSLEDFKTIGCRVKHLLCWRRTRGLEIGGVDEEILHGADDYDFPWRMMEAGCRFRAVPECLYHYREHHDFQRLTSHNTLELQVAELRKMFGKHKVSQSETDAYIENALKGYLIQDKTFSFEPERVDVLGLAQRGHIEADRAEEFRGQDFFPHELLVLPRGDFKRANRLYGVRDPNRLWKLVLSPKGSAAGQTLTAELVIDGARLSVCALDSGPLLLNALLALASRRGCKTVCLPIDSSVYPTRRERDRWIIDVQAQLGAVALPEVREEVVEWGRTVCVCHEVGHSDSLAALKPILAVEAEVGARSTYFVAPARLGEVRGAITAGGHALAFSGEEDPSGLAARMLARAKAWFGSFDSRALAECRLHDSEITGYRLGEECGDASFCFFGIEWIAGSVGRSGAGLENRLVKIPLSPTAPAADYEAWESRVVERVKTNDFAALSLHDRSLWLPHYRRFLEKIQGLASLKTLSEVAEQRILAGSRF